MTVSGKIDNKPNETVYVAEKLCTKSLTEKFLHISLY